MRSEAELVALANESFVVSFRKVVEHTPAGGYREFGGVVAYATGLPLSFFNGCAVVESATPGDLDAAMRWIAGRRVPYRVFVASELEAGLAAVPLAHGLERHPVPYPGMVLHPLPEPPAPASGVAIAAAGVEDREEFLEIVEAAGLRASRRGGALHFGLHGDDDVQAFVARLDGRPVGNSLAIRSAGTSGVHNVGTLPAARRRGVGTALTWAAVAAGRDMGFDCAVLQSSEMAVSMYEAMGFRTVVTYTTFNQPAG